jgi:Skp family chaperone for outer membrane proteins
MRVFALAFTVVLAADAALAQAPAAPAQTPAAPAPAPAAQVPTPRFQDGLRYAFVDYQAVAAFSAVGKAAAQQIETLRSQKERELQDRQRTIQEQQQKLEASAGVLSDQARLKQQQDIERQQRELARQSEDAQAEVEQLLQQVEVEFRGQTAAAVARVAQQKQVHFVFDPVQSGLIWAVPGMDLTAEVIQEVDNPSAAAAPATATPAIPAPPTVGSPQ